MARGLPAVWSALVGLPLVVLGGVIYAAPSALPVSGPSTPPAVGLVLAAFGVFVVGLGLYVHVVAAPEAPRMREGERVVDDRDPAQRNALAEVVVALPVLGAGVYLLYFTDYPYLYPTVVLGGALYLFSSGLHRYWRNTLTTYLVTTQRVIEEYRFVSLVRNEVPHGKVRAVEERRSAWDSLFGLGGVAVRSGAAGSLTVSIDDVYDSTEFADEIRAQVSPDATAPGDTPTGAGDDADLESEGRGTDGGDENDADGGEAANDDGDGDGDGA